MRAKPLIQKKQNKEDLIHVKLEYDELIQSKKDLLSTESDLIELIKIIKTYQQIRISELKLKNRLYEKLKTTHRELKKLDVLLPTGNFPEKIKTIEKEKSEYREEPVSKLKKDPLEAQLEEIQRKLKSLEG